MALSGGLAACGGGSSKTAMPEPEPEPELTAQQECEMAMGRYETDGSCTSAEDVAAEEAAELAATTKAAGTKATAIAAEAAQGGLGTTEMHADAGLGGSMTDGTPVIGYTLAIDEDGTKVSITVEATDKDDVMFDLAEDMMDGRTMHTRMHDADDDGNVVTEVAIVYNDRDAPTMVSFADFELVTVSDDGTSTTTDMPQMLNARDLDENMDGTDGDGNMTNDYTALNVITANVAQIMASGFSSSGAGDLTYAFDDSDTADMDEAFETEGTYNGAPGTYRCTGTSRCQVTYDAMGEISAVGTGWVFTPAMGAESPQPQYDYLHYGFWLQKTEDADDMVTYNEVETFAGSSAQTSGSVASVTGSAEYSGGAVGVYTMNNEYDSSTGDVIDRSSGDFHATVNLKATFGQVPVSDGDDTGTIAENLLNTLTGMVSNFMLSGDEENSWSAALDGDIDAAEGTASGNTMVGDDDVGDFSATFHGDVTAVEGVAPHPGSVVGEFGAVFSDGSVAGAFGARVKEEE